MNPTNNRFTETGYSYDLNGNILTMTRNDGRSSGTMDILSYNYGNFGNQLQAVTDGGDKNKGFVDLNTSLQDYRYDANGNMINDLNKGIGDNINDNVNRIQYNFLNLPELITKRNASLRYIYDATGRKLAQVANYGTSSVTTDYVGEFVYEDNRLQFINHEEGRIVMSAVQTTAMYNGENTNNVTASNVTLSNITQNGTEKYLRATSTGATARSGVNRIGGTQAVVGGEVYKIRLKGYTTGTNPAFLNIRTNNTDLDWMNVRLPNNEKTEIWVERTITIPAGHTSMEVNVQWNTVNATDVMFINELEIIKQQSKSPEYQYYHKDHLGNIRLVFTTIQEQEIANAGYETANLSAETGRFQRMANARRVNSSIFDRTNGANSGFSQRLTGGTNEKYGIARTVKVMPGDTVKMEVYAKYVDRNQANWTSGFQTLMNSIAAANPAGGVVVDGSSYSTSTSSFPFPSQHNFTDRTSGTAPRAFLNYISFDDNWNPILLDNTQTNFVRLSSTPIERGQDVAHERMAASFVVKHPGYVYIYVSNDETTPLEVFFDDFTVTHAKGPVVQSQDYYPFGLTLSSYQAENSVNNKRLYNGKELQGALDMDFYEYGWRTYSPVIGRWGQVDPLVDSYEGWSPYNYVQDNPISRNDPDGRWVNFVVGAIVGAATDYGAQVIVNLAEGKNLKEALTDVDGTSIAASAALGALTSGASAMTTTIGAQAGKQAVQSTTKQVVKQTTKVVTTTAVKVKTLQSSNAARREVMREQKIPTSQQPKSQSKNKSGREYTYETKGEGGKPEKKSVQQQTMDSSHKDEPHWEAAKVKTNESGDVRMTNHGRPKLENDKSKVYYKTTGS